jgi:methionyl-tRNA formyltransferase
MRLVYLGTPEAAVPPLEALVAAGHQVLLVVSQPDRKRGRGGALVPSPVKAAAVALGLPVTDQLDDVLGCGAELGVVVAFGRLIKPVHLSTMPYVNIHFSLLPRWRGAAPVERAILAGDSQTGCCLMALEEGLDTGPVYRRQSVSIESDESASALRSRLVALGTRMLVDALSNGFDSLGQAEPQTGQPTHAAKLQPQDFALDWTRPAGELHRVIRLEQGWTTFRGKRLKVLQAAPMPDPQHSQQGPQIPGSLVGVVVVCGQSSWLQLQVVQPEGKAPMRAADWLNGARPGNDERLITDISQGTL